MCTFKSAIITKSGDVLHSPFTDSHEDLVRLFKLNDSADVRGEPRFARVEFRPEFRKDSADISKYSLLIDAARTPDWFDSAMHASVVSRLSLIIKDMIITGDVDLLVGGKYILAVGAHVSCVKNCSIEAMLGNSKVGEMRGSSNVGIMLGNSNVGEMRESSKVGVMREGSKVGVMRGSSKVGVMWGSSNVGVMLGNSNVGEMWGSSNVGEMRESSKVGVMREGSKVNENSPETQTKAKANP